MKVLIVDDTNTLRSLVQIYLLAHGWEFFEATNGAEGLEKARALRPDVIITDVNMPGMNGFDLCEAIRKDPQLANVPVVVLTLHGDEVARERGRQVGASAFLTKPVSPAELKQALRSVAPSLVPRA